MTCPWCLGTGKVQHTDEAGTKDAYCEKCAGSGKVLDPIPAEE